MNKFNDVLKSGKKLTDLPADQQAKFDSLINYIKNDHTFRPVVLSAMHNATIYFATGFRSGIVSTTTISVPDDMISIIAPDLISKYRCSLPIGYTFAQTKPFQTLDVYWSIGITDAWCLITPKDEGATVHYVVDDDRSTSIPDDTTSGKYGTSVNYSSLVPSDYTLASQGSYTFTDAANQSFTIHLNKGTREARPGDGGTSAGDYSKTVTRSFNVIAPPGHTVTAPSTQSITLTRSGTYNAITKRVTFGNWSMGYFTAVTAPTITGYTAYASASNVNERIGGGTRVPSNEIVTITYTINEESATVHYVDDDDCSRSIPDGTTSAGENNSASTVNTNNNDSEEPKALVTYQQLVLYIGKHGRIVKKGYITVSEDNDSLTEMFRLAKVKSKMPKGYKATGKIKKVAKYLYVWVTKKNQPSFNEAPRTKDVLYVAKNGKIVKRTRITGSVRKLAKSKLPKGYKISGIDRVNNHYDVWIKKEK